MNETRSVHPIVSVAAAYAWRLLVVGVFLWGVVWVADRLLVVLVPLAVAGLLARALWPVSRWLRQRVPPALAATLTELGFVLVLVGGLGLVGWAVAGQVDELGPTLDRALDDVTDWLVDDSPFDVTRDDVDGWRETAEEMLPEVVTDGATATSGIVLAGEIVVGTLLSLVVTFFLLKDGNRMADRAVQLAPTRHRPVTARAIRRGWDAAGGYLRGAALLGAIEAVIIGVTSFLVGAELVAAVMLLTFLAAFVPIAGAVVSGAVAVMVALVTAGTSAAVVVAVVAILVQQFDNDLLAPAIYGRATRLHPLVVLLGIVAGGALFGFVGAVFAVPFLAVVINAVDEVRHGGRPTNPRAEPQASLAET